MATIPLRVGCTPVDKDTRTAAPSHGPRLFVDEAYAATVVKPAEYLAAGGRQFDAFLGGFARLVSVLPVAGGAVLRPLQNGLVQFYALGMVLGLAVFLAVIVFRSSR